MRYFISELVSTKIISRKLNIVAYLMHYLSTVSSLILTTLVRQRCVSLVLCLPHHHQLGLSVSLHCLSYDSSSSTFLPPGSWRSGLSCHPPVKWFIQNFGNHGPCPCLPHRVFVILSHQCCYVSAPPKFNF